MQIRFFISLFTGNHQKSPCKTLYLRLFVMQIFNKRSPEFPMQGLVLKNTDKIITRSDTIAKYKHILVLHLCYLLFKFFLGLSSFLYNFNFYLVLVLNKEKTMCKYYKMWKKTQNLVILCSVFVLCKFYFQPS